jgi:hypothetical protein
MALYHRDVMSRVLLLHEQGEIKPCWAATDAQNIHAHNVEA